MPSRRTRKDELYAQFARIGHALASPKRLELLDLLAQGERTVEAIAEEIEVPVKNTSAHLRVLRQAHLVATRREGTFVFYRLADDEAVRLLRSLEAVAHRGLADVRDAAQAYLGSPDTVEPVSLAELRRLVQSRAVTVLDVRPSEEYVAGHIPGARSLPVADLKRRLRELPRAREVVAYCRGPFCVFANDAVALLRRHGYKARRAEQGLPDWRAAGLPVERGA
jgi:rhodanese-related sulfurtransferase/DNA-binding transcriptional ArsR family regulator